MKIAKDGRARIARAFQDLSNMHGADPDSFGSGYLGALFTDQCLDERDHVRAG